MTIDRSALMTTAWTDTRRMMRDFSYAAHQLREVFRYCLSAAWAKAKNAAALAALTSEQLRAMADNLENRTRLGWEGIERLGALRTACRVAEAREAAEREAADMQAKRELIASAGGRFCAVTFTKKDGSERVMRVQPAKLRHHVKGDAATDAGKRAAATRAQRHPNLMPVWDAEKDAPRSVNLATVSRIAVNGQVHSFAH
ncbi:MAG: hypothetical protein CL813_06170 [Confluentimicrobium sp.]|mgnify:CR=1 FL=1|nr:hypothetical protein [Actibacterium sp.]|tara:strand:+ start:4448 stop:5047 length:600 start_codon:yes stop_codon:yes gene_type:complete